MSFESQLIILRKSTNDDIYFKEEKLKEIKNSYKELFKDFLFDKEQIENFKFPEFLPIKLDEDDKFISLVDNQEYLNIVSTHFCSDFTILKDYFNLNQYTGNNQVVLDEKLVKEMLQSINYILNFKHSIELEDLLNLHWIEKYGKLLPSFINRFDSKCKNCLSNEDKEFEYTGKYILNRVRTIFETYLLLLDEDLLNKYKYVLLYYI